MIQREYTILMHKDIDGLGSKVNAMLTIGYVTAGGVMFDGKKFYQAVVKTYTEDKLLNG